MTAKEAIRRIKRYVMVTNANKEQKAAFDLAIAALEATNHDKQCLNCKHLHCDTYCDHGEGFEGRE